MAKHLKNPPGIGKGFLFFGSFTSKIAAKKKESQIPGSFIHEKDGRYYVLKPKKITSRSNPSRALIYEKITRIEGTKGKGSQFAGQRFFHNFKKPYPRMYGLANGDLLITSRK